MSVIAACGRGCFGFIAQSEIWMQVLIFIGAGVVVYLGEFLFKLIRAPARMDKELRVQLATTKQDAEKQLAAQETRSEESFNQLVVAHAKHVALLEHQIESLQAQVNDREKRKAAEVKLGGYYRALVRRVDEIRKMYFPEYSQKYQDAYSRGNFDPDTQVLLDEIQAFLDSSVGGAFTAVFNDRSGFKETPVAGFGEGVSVALSAQMLELNQQQKHWHLITDRLNHYAAQLMKVIEQYIAS
jgi:hypothetical protein